MIEIIGWFGALFFSICAAPQAWQSWKQGHSEGLNDFFLWTWFLGEVCMLIYSIDLKSLPLIINYILNFSMLLVIMRYKYFKRD